MIRYYSALRVMLSAHVHVELVEEIKNSNAKYKSKLKFLVKVGGFEMAKRDFHIFLIIPSVIYSQSLEGKTRGE